MSVLLLLTASLPSQTSLRFVVLVPCYAGVCHVVYSLFLARTCNFRAWFVWWYRLSVVC